MTSPELFDRLALKIECPATEEARRAHPRKPCLAKCTGAQPTSPCECWCGGICHSSGVCILDLRRRQ